MSPAFDVNAEDEMSTIPKNFKASISQVLDKVAFDLVRQCISSTDHINHIVYRNGILSCINKIKEKMAIPTKGEKPEYSAITRTKIQIKPGQSKR